MQKLFVLFCLVDAKVLAAVDYKSYFDLRCKSYFGFNEKALDVVDVAILKSYFFVQLFEIYFPEKIKFKKDTSLCVL